MELNDHLLPEEAEKSKPCECPTLCGCEKIGYQYLDISVPIEVSPNVTVGQIEAECCGEPSVCCKENSAGSTCEITVTQRISLSLPIRYGITACKGGNKINCACSESCASSGSR